MKDTLQQALISIDRLQHQVDTLKSAQTLDQLKFRTNEYQDIVNKVNDYYDHSFQTLLWLIGGLFIIFGILQPLISGWYQRRNLQDLTNAISNQVTETIEQKLLILDEKYQLEIHKLNLEFKAKENDLDILHIGIKNQLDSYAFFTIGYSLHASGKFKESVQSYTSALSNWMELNDDKNVEAVLIALDRVIHHVSKSDFENLMEFYSVKNRESKSLINVLNTLKSIEVFNKYLNDIEQIELKISQLK